VTPRNVVNGSRRFGRTCYIHLQVVDGGSRLLQNFDDHLSELINSLIVD